MLPSTRDTCRLLLLLLLLLLFGLHVGGETADCALLGCCVLARLGGGEGVGVGEFGGVGGSLGGVLLELLLLHGV